jgi:hypothetical protein
VRADDQFHVGIVVDDFDDARAGLSKALGHEWCDVIAMPVPVWLPSGETEIDLAFAYSRTTPRVELIRTIPGTVWEPVAGSGIHHLGYWSDDVARDSAALAEHGYAVEAAGLREDGSRHWAYLHREDRPRIELVTRELEPLLAQLWAPAHDTDLGRTT